ncbi:MAG: winged helix-turn-helix domain-containing protein [Clostridiales bacterium]|nr:winged helix-turn-helix domain-containing protein [Clostridiales bacterium]
MWMKKGCWLRFRTFSCRRIYRRKGELVKLTPKEYNHLLFFCRNQNRAFSGSTLLDLVWCYGYKYEGSYTVNIERRNGYI